MHRIISIFSDLSQLYTIRHQRSPRVKYAPSYHVCHICAFKGPVLNLISFAIFQRTRLDLAWEFVKCVRLPSRYEYSPQKPLNASTVKSIPKYQIWILIQILETFLQSIQIHLVVQQLPGNKRKVPGGRGHFQSKNLYCRFWTERSKDFPLQYTDVERLGFDLTLLLFDVSSYFSIEWSGTFCDTTKRKSWSWCLHIL